MKALALLLAALLFAACSADNTTTTDATETTTDETTIEPQESDDQTQKRSAIAGSADYAQDLDISQQRQYPYPGNTGQGSYGGNYNNPNYGHYGSEHGYENVIPGTAVRDYPIYAHPPITRFSCKGLPAGLYADLESRCQAWHICQEDGRHDRFLCANGTLFNQKFLVCDWWYNVECGRSGQYVGGSPYPPYQPKPIYPTDIYNPSHPKKPQQPYYPPAPKPTQKPYYPNQLPQQPYPPQGPQLPHYPPQVPQQPFPPQFPQQPYPPQVPQKPFPPLVPQQPYPPQVPQQPYLPQGPRPSYPQGPHITFPGQYIPRENEGNYYPADIGSGAINRNSGKLNENSPQSFPLYRAAPSTKTTSTVDFPTGRKLADKGNEQEDFEPVQY